MARNSAGLAVRCSRRAVPRSRSGSPPSALPKLARGLPSASPAHARPCVWQVGDAGHRHNLWAKGRPANSDSSLQQLQCLWAGRACCAAECAHVPLSSGDVLWGPAEGSCRGCVCALRQQKYPSMAQGPPGLAAACSSCTASSRARMLGAWLRGWATQWRSRRPPYTSCPSVQDQIILQHMAERAPATVSCVIT